MEEQKKMDIREFRDLGLVSEINRRLLHPLGMALEIVVNPDGSVRLGEVWDGRDDPEGFYYDGTPEFLDSLARKQETVTRLTLDRAEARKNALGYVIQNFI